MTLSTTTLIDRIISGKQIFPFDWVNHPIFMDPYPEAGTEYTLRLTDSTKMANLVAEEMSHGLDPAFRASAMSNGELARELVNSAAGAEESRIRQYAERRFGRPLKTTQSLKTTVAGSELLNRVILPNREADYRAANEIETRFPDMSVFYPIGFENAVRMQRASNAQSQGATFQDWTFEYYWGVRVIRANHHILDGEKRYASRYLGVEDIIADFIQAGMLDDYREGRVPGKQFNVIDGNGNPVTLADRAWGRAKHIFEWTEDDFAADLAVGVLLAQFQLDDWLRGEGKPEGFPALDRKKLHPVLAKRSKEELARMDRLKEMMLPYIAEKCVDLVPYLKDPNLKKYVEEKVLPAKGKFKDLDLAKMKEELFSESILGDMNSSDLKPKKATGVAGKFAAAADAQSFVGRPAKLRDTDGRYFQRKGRLFDDSHFDKLTVREQAALTFILGAMEGRGRLPENAPRSLFYVAEPKGGALAKEYMEEHDIDWLKEAYSDEEADTGSAFAKQVIAKNAARMAKDVATLAANEDIAGRGIKNIVSTGNFLNIMNGAEQYHNFVAAKGPEKLSPRARLALMIERLDRDPQAIAVRKDWAIHHDESALVLRALQIATGLVSRPYSGGDYKMEIFVYDEAKKTVVKQDLHDIVMTMGKTVGAMLDKMPPPEAREQYLAMARMVQILDMYMDPGRMNFEYVKDPKTGDVTPKEIIHWREVDPALMAFWHQDAAKKAEIREMRDSVRQKLLDSAVLHFSEEDLEGLHEDFRAKWLAAHGSDAAQRRRAYDGQGTKQTYEGPT